MQRGISGNWHPVAWVWATLLLAAALAAQERGPNSSIMQQPTESEEIPTPLTIENGSPIRPIPVPPRQIKLNDIISIRVDELARMQSEGEVDRRKNARINSVLLDWLTLNGFGAAKPDPQRDGDQRIQGRLDTVYRAENSIDTSERLSFNIAARVVDIRPNGNLVLEAHKEIRSNDELWRASLTGICRQQDVGPDNVVLSRNIVDLQINKYEHGHVADSTQRGWLLRLYDLLHPF